MVTRPLPRERNSTVRGDQSATRNKTVAQRIGKPVGRADESAASHRPAPVSKATGLLIPSLARGVPRVLKAGVNCDTEMVRKLLEHELLKPSDRASTIDRLIDTGVERMIGPHLSDYESDWGGELMQISGTPDHLRVGCYDNCIDLRFSVKSSLDVIGIKTEAARWAATVINQHWAISSPANWDNIVNEGLNVRRVPGEVPAEEVSYDDDASAEEVAERSKFMVKMKAEFPQLFISCYEGDKKTKADIAKFNTSLMIQSTHHLAYIKRRDPRLVNIFSDLVATLGKPRFFDGACYCCTYWEMGDLINHGWDFVQHQYMEGNYDNSGESLLAFGGTIPECLELFKQADRWIGAAKTLCEYAPR